MRSVLFSLAILFVQQGHAQDASRKIVEGISTAKQTEFAPSVSADGKTMIFQSDGGSGWELYESKLQDDGSWSKPFPLVEINDKCDFLAGPSLSYDGNTLYFTAFVEGETESEDIYFSTRIDDKSWSEPLPIGAPINTDDDYEGFPSVSSDGNSLYFIRLNFDYPYDRKSKENCFRIYVSHKTEDGSWGEPEMLPEHINMGCERDPKIMADNHTLIFSSIREGGNGKYDLYQTRKQEDGSWGEVVPLNFVNSTDNDQSPSISASGDKMFFYSSKDIYEIEIPKEYRQMINITVQGIIRELESNQAVSAKILVKKAETDELLASTDNNPNDGKYSLVLQGGENYKILFSNDDYFLDSLMLDFSTITSYKEVRENINLKSAYSLVFSIKDKDLSKPLTSYVKIKDNEGNMIYEDSLAKENMPYTFRMSTKRSYELEVMAPGYPLWKEPLIFDQSSFRDTTVFLAEIPFEKVKFQANVKDIVSNNKMKMKVFLNNKDEDEVITVESGETVYLRKGNRYEVMTSSDKGYVYTSKDIVAGEGEPDAYGGYSLEMDVLPIKKGMNLSLNHIVFDFNSAALDSVSTFELNRIVELMNKNADIKIEIAAHTDDVGSAAYNLDLSKKRAASVVAYLVGQDIAKDRVFPKGYGMEKPIVPNDSDENRAKNRRVELIIVESTTDEGDL